MAGSVLPNSPREISFCRVAILSIRIVDFVFKPFVFEGVILILNSLSFFGLVEEIKATIKSPDLLFADKTSAGRIF